MNESIQGGNTKRMEDSEQQLDHSRHYMPYHILTVGTEPALLHAQSPVRRRIFSYGKHFERMHIILMCGRVGVARIDEGNISVYPTNSRLALLRYIDALRIGFKIPRVDIVSTQDPFETALAAYCIAWFFSAPLHVQVHTDFLTPAFERHSLVNWLRVKIAGFILRHAAGIRVVSKPLKQGIEKRYAPRAPISVLPIFVDLERFRHATVPAELLQRFSAYKNKLLIVSRLEKEKNVRIAIKAFAAKRGEGDCLIVVGSGTEKIALEQLAESLHVREHVYFEGFQDPAQYFALCDLTLVPSAYEGYGQVIIESLAAGTPVLARDVGVAREAGAIVAGDDFAHSLGEWLVNGERSAALREYPYESLDEYVRKYCADIGSLKR